MGAELAGGAWGEVRQGPAAMGRGEGAASGCAGARTTQGGPRPRSPIYTINLEIRGTTTEAKSEMAILGPYGR